MYLSWACRLLRGRRLDFVLVMGMKGSLELGEQDFVLVLGMQAPKK